MGSLFALNTKALETFSQQQTEFFTGFMADSVKYVESLSVQTEVKGYVAAQTAYAESVKDRFAHASSLDIDLCGGIHQKGNAHPMAVKAQVARTCLETPRTLGEFPLLSSPTHFQNIVLLICIFDVLKAIDVGCDIVIKSRYGGSATGHSQCDRNCCDQYSFLQGNSPHCGAIFPCLELESSTHWTGKTCREMN